MKNLCHADEIIFLKNASNLYYFSGLNNPDAYILFVGEQKYYFTDDRYMENAEKCLKEYSVHHIRDFDSIFTSNIYHFEKLGIEDDLPYLFCKDLEKKGAINFYSISKDIMFMRANKSSEEIKKIQKAQSITDKVFSIILHQVKEGMTEKELACILESELYKNGAEELAFRSIVAFDDNTSIPHAERTDRKLKNGSIITLDFGAKCENYCSDMTRTFFFGKADEEMVKTYEIVLSAQQRAIENAMVGMTTKECDSIARSYFKSKGLDKFFLHSLGHGVGIDIHEYPTVSPRSDAVIGENMLITIEPGLYFAGKYGIRIEDMIIFDKTGVINLTKSPKNIIIV